MLVSPKFATKLSPRVVRELSELIPPWGPCGYITYKRTYARLIEEEGRTEEWHETVERGCNGILEIGGVFTHEQIKDLAYYWFMLKGCPAGRPIWQLGTETVRRVGGDSLVNCWHVACNHPIDPFTFTFNQLMLGGGVGFSIDPEYVYEIPAVKFAPRVTRVDDFDCDYIATDNREGWVELLRRALDAFFFSGKDLRYSTHCIRPAGRPIKGFGGVASGPEKLVEGIGLITDILRSRLGRKLTPTNCMDVMNIIGMIVVAGNVRRCFPGNTAIHTRDGYLPIEEIRVGDYVQTLEGYKKVTNTFAQGEQPIFSVILSNGQAIDCTRNHKFAVLGEEEEIEWVEAQDLEPGDTLLYNHTPCEGKSGDTKEAYFMGLLAGDGNVYFPKHGGSVTFACSSDAKQVGITDRIYEYADSLGLTAHESNTGANGHQVRIYDKTLAEKLLPYKIPHQCPIIPDWIYQAAPNCKVAYLAGLCDADGTPSKYNLCSSKYIGLLREAQLLAASLGIVTRIDTRPDRVLTATGKTYDNENMLIIVGYESKQLACELLNPYIVRQFPQREEATDDLSIPLRLKPLGYKTYPDERIRERIIHKNLKKHSSLWNKVAPVQVVDSYDLEVIVPTYDIEVEGEHCFFAEGVLVHNSAEIAVGSPYDMEFLEAKDWSRKIVPPWRQQSNNTVRCADTILLPEYFWRGYSPGCGEAYGLFNDSLCRRYGRLVDDENYRPDPLLAGPNPCGEIILEPYEGCNLAEQFLPNINGVTEFGKVAALLFRAAKAIGRLPYWHPKTNEVVTRNNRIGISITGYLQSKFVGDSEAFDAVYDHLEETDKEVSREMNCRRSIKLTTVKPSGTLSLLAGVTPGVHAAFSRYYIRRISFSANDVLVESARKNGYNIAPKINIDGSKDFGTLVVDFPVKMPADTQCATGYSAISQLENQLFLQRHWADNSVSCTIYYQEHELPEIREWLGEHYAHEVKTTSFLLHQEHGFVQAPYEEITEEQFNEMAARIQPILSIHDTQERDLIDSVECGSGGCPVK